MLEKIFGSKTRVMLLRLFLSHPDDFFFVREITRALGVHLNAVRRELNNLEKIGIIASFTKEEMEKEAEKELRNNKRYYKLNTNFVFIDELTALMVRGHLLLERSLLEQAEKLGHVVYLLLSGVLVGRNDAPADLLIVGKVNRDRLAKLVAGFERELGQPINYTMMTKDDFEYRLDVADKFIYDLLDNKHFVAIDKIIKK